MKASVRTENLSFVVMEVMQEKQWEWQEKLSNYNEKIIADLFNFTNHWYVLMDAFSNVGRWLVEVCCGLTVLERKGSWKGESS